ncbi:MAG: hypothetical protein M5U25_10235 [Planctomycetota bacterium]|nr:hypothetical protein [Planctomycetota bacterium]
MLKLVTAVVCESASEAAPYTLIRVRKRWRTPPAELCVYLEVLNATGEPYDVAAQIRRKSTIVAAFETELVLMSKRDLDEVILTLPLEGLEPRTYGINLLLNGVVADTLWVDFGHPEAAI